MQQIQTVITVVYWQTGTLFVETDQHRSVTTANPDAKRLYDDLLSNYNKLVRPVANVSDALTVKIKLKLSQLIDVVNKPHTYIYIYMN